MAMDSVIEQLNTATSYLNPEVTVLMAVYNGERYVRDSIESIQQQTWSNFEFLIINDGSTDCTKDIVENAASNDKRIRVLNLKSNMGLAVALNLGIEKARGAGLERCEKAIG